MSEETTAGAAKRPGFLTVLIVLTFIGSAIGIYQSLTMDPLIKAYAGYYPWVLLLLNLGTAFGAFQMLSLKKTGLYIWTACEVLALILAWVVVKGFVSSMMGDVGAATDSDIGAAFANAGNAMLQSAMNMALIIATIFPALFILLYWLNAKHMK